MSYGDAHYTAERLVILAECAHDDTLRELCNSAAETIGQLARENEYMRGRAGLVPRDKIAGQRFGQLIYNALRHRLDLLSDRQVADKLFNISNRELGNLLKKHIEATEAMLASAQADVNALYGGNSK